MGKKILTHFLPYTTQQLYELVVDIEKYPEFLPWCLGARVISTTEYEIMADLTVGYSVFRETFRSCVHITPHSKVEIEYVSGPFHHLHNVWEFKETSNGGTNINFYIDFKLRNHFFQSAIQMAFDKAFSQMLSAFEKRAGELYGEGSIKADGFSSSV